MNFKSLARNSLRALGVLALMTAFDSPAKHEIPHRHYQVASISNSLSPLERRLESETEFKDDKKNKYALLLSGNTELNDTYDLSLIYQVCLENGFKKENIFILDAEGVKTPLYPVDAGSTIENIKKVTSHLYKKIDSKDLLFVYITDHGDRVMYQPKNVKSAKPIQVSEISLNKEDLNEVDLENILNNIKSKQTVVFADICYGGGFANRFSHGRYVGISSCTENQEATSDDKESFGKLFFEAYRETQESDTNHDGKISVKEAFEYARIRCPYTRNNENTPYLKSELDLDKLSLK